MRRGNNELVRRSLDDHLHRHCAGLRQSRMPAHPRVAHAAVAKATRESGAIIPIIALLQRPLLTISRCRFEVTQYGSGAVPR